MDLAKAQPSSRMIAEPLCCLQRIPTMQLLQMHPWKEELEPALVDPSTSQSLAPEPLKEKIAATVAVVAVITIAWRTSCRSRQSQLLESVAALARVLVEPYPITRADLLAWREPSTKASLDL